MTEVGVSKVDQCKFTTRADVICRCMEAERSMATPPAKIVKMSDTGMAQPDEPMEVAAAETSEYGVYEFLYS